MEQTAEKSLSSPDHDKANRLVSTAGSCENSRDGWLEESLRASPLRWKKASEANVRHLLGF